MRNAPSIHNLCPVIPPRVLFIKIIIPELAAKVKPFENFYDFFSYTINIAVFASGLLKRGLLL